MSKLSYEDKIDIYNKRKNGYTKISLAKEYNVSVSIIDYLFRLINKHDRIKVKLKGLSPVNYRLQSSN